MAVYTHSYTQLCIYIYIYIIIIKLLLENFIHFIILYQWKCILCIQSFAAIIMKCEVVFFDFELFFFSSFFSSLYTNSLSYLRERESESEREGAIHSCIMNRYSSLVNIHSKVYHNSDLFVVSILNSLFPLYS